MAWLGNFRVNRDIARRAFDVANNSGDLIYATHAWWVTISNRIAAGDPLAEVQREAEAGVAFAEKVGFGFVAGIITTQLGLIRTLRGLTPIFGSFDDGYSSDPGSEGQSSGNPTLARIACWDDPSAIVPERALVFEVTGTLTDFYRALGSIPGLELLGEEEDELAADDDFTIVEKGERKPAKPVPVRLYFTIPDTEALRELVRLWELFKAGQPLEHGKGQWKNVFEHLADVRPWGPKDRLTDETIANRNDRLDAAGGEPVRFEVEFWYRDQ
jgi:hypothetical protein